MNRSFNAFANTFGRTRYSGPSTVRILKPQHAMCWNHGNLRPGDTGVGATGGSPCGPDNRWRLPPFETQRLATAAQSPQASGHGGDRPVAPTQLVNAGPSRLAER